MNHDNLHILVVDDSPINLNLLGHILESDYQVSVASSALEAMGIFAQALPDLILLDIMMPDMDGYEMIQAIKKNPQLVNIPVIFITAKNDEASEIKALKLGAVDFISKPINPAIAKIRIKNHLLLKQQKQRLEQEKTILKTVIGAVSNGLIAYDCQGHILEINLPIYQLWPQLNKVLQVTNNTIGQIFKQFLLPDVDQHYGDYHSFHALIDQPNRLRLQGRIKLHNGNIYQFFSAPLQYKENHLGFLLGFNDMTKEILLGAELERISITDELTGLYNRRHFNVIIKRELAVALRYRTILGLLIIDIDFFKKINDTWGHSTGDKVLVSVADKIAQQLRQIDFCFRYGGEEFIVLLPNTNRQGIFDTGKRLMSAVGQVNIGNMNVSVSIGAASTQDLSRQTDKPVTDVLLDLADIELYRAKNQGRQRMYIAGQSNAVVLEG